MNVTDKEIFLLLMSKERKNKSANYGSVDKIFVGVQVYKKKN